MMDWSEIADRAARSFLQGAASAVMLLWGAGSVLDVHLTGGAPAVIVVGGIVGVASAVMNGSIKLGREAKARLSPPSA